MTSDGGPQMTLGWRSQMTLGWRSQMTPVTTDDPVLEVTDDPSQRPKVETQWRGTLPQHRKPHS